METSLIKKDNTDTEELATTTRDNELSLAYLEESERFFEMVRQRALSKITPSMIVTFGGKPYLDENASVIIGRRFRVTTEFIEKPVKEEEEDKDGRYVSYTCYMRAGWKSKNEWAEAVGVATSRDKFLGTGGGRAFEEVNLGDIKKKAVTNARRNAICAFLGLDVSWEELANVGINQDKVSSVGFKKGRYSKQQQSLQKTHTSGNGKKDWSRLTKLHETGLVSKKDMEAKSKEWMNKELNDLDQKEVNILAEKFEHQIDKGSQNEQSS